ncbi:MAG: hypothetical protein H6582_14135 [Crocinitomicaceae bacterium]|nr:hypothetical protein [Crocinitomicaceae bacterium]
MYHNLLNFPSFQPERVDSLRIILNYTQPDVYVVNELESAVGADLILNNALNSFGTSNYERATFYDGYDTDNGFFYNSDKLGLVSQMQIGTSLRDISEYVMYYKSPNYTATSDTVYLHFFSCHLKAGSADYEQRKQEALQVKYYLNDISDKVQNVFVGGDFNFYSGYESGCQTLLNFGSVPLFDPVNMIGNWSGDWSFASVHTQSTRINALGDGSGGGLDDRFDLILVSEDVLNNQHGVSYISNSFKPLGQDGNRFNSSIIAPTNNSVPDSVSNALYYASDHLPVLMDVKIDQFASFSKIENHYLKVFFESEFQNINIISSYSNFTFNLYDSAGRLVLSDQNSALIPCSIDPGIYIWQIDTGESTYSNKLLIP